MDKLLEDITDELVSSISENDAIELYFKLKNKFDWSGTFFTYSDIEDVWYNCVDVEDGLENSGDSIPNDVLKKVTDSYEWNHLSEFLDERGFEVLYSAVSSVIAEEK